MRPGNRSSSLPLSPPEPPLPAPSVAGSCDERQSLRVSGDMLLSDALLLVLIVALLGFVALLACLIPARRASTMNTTCVTSSARCATRTRRRAMQ